MFIIHGTKPFKRVIGKLHAETLCPNCQRTANWEVIRVISFFTLYFIPLFPYKVCYYLACPHCDAGKKIKKEAAMELLSGSINSETIHNQQQMNADRQEPEKESNQFEFYEAYTYKLPVEQMVKSEKKVLLKNYAIFIIGAILMFLIFFKNGYSWIPLIVLAAALLMIFIVLPAHTIKLLVINRKRAPASIYMYYNSLRFGSHSISLRTIKRIEATSMKITSNSIFPVQRYLVIHTDTKKERFWFGSPFSFPDNEYAEICSSLENICHNGNIPFKYSMKQSIWTK